MKDVTVIGSCVCRDLFETDSGNYEFLTDIRFSSPISMLAERVDGVEVGFNNFIKNVKTVNGKWYKKNLINDINKTAFDALYERHGEYLILDLAESRISIAKITWEDREKSLLVSNSVSFREHYKCSLSKNVFKKTKITVINPLDYDIDFWEVTIKKFAEKITSLFSENKIILIKNMPAKYYKDNNGNLMPYYSGNHFDSIVLCDILLPKLYDLFIKECPKCNIIEIPPFAIGLQSHKWGNHPFHFVPSYYEYLLKCVNSIIFDNNKNLDSLYSEYKNIFEDEFNNARLSTAKKQNRINMGESGIVDALMEYEEYNLLGKRQKTLILYALDRKNFLKNFKSLRKNKNN